MPQIKPAINKTITPATKTSIVMIGILMEIMLYLILFAQFTTKSGNNKRMIVRIV